ncbi:MAG: IS110 family transposase [Deltaproteobacteria bacterium]|nr:IS110 family transposase [Deltaproteobacteria bacterium]
MKKTNIYQNQSQELLHLFEEAGGGAKVMCVPMDYAKKDHLVMFLNGHGDILRKPFSVKNTPEGIGYIEDQVTRSCRRRGIEKKHVFFGGEDANSFAKNFVSTLRGKGFVVANVNAHDAKKQRVNMQASTDRIDLMGIATMLLNCRANCCAAQSGIYRNLRTLVRHRRRLVQMLTEVKNRVHGVVDELFPGFLNEKNSGIVPFTQSSLYLMQDRFSPKQIRRRRRQKLIDILKRSGTSKAEKTAAKLQQYAATVLHAPVEYVDTMQLSLAQHVKHIGCLKESVAQMEKQIALNLAQTQGAFLTSVRGIGLVLAAGVTAEIGDPNAQKPLNNLASYAGIIPRVKQTGGWDGKTYSRPVAKRCNRILKDYVVKSAYHLGLHGPPDLMADYKRRDASGQHADFGIGRRYLRMAKSLMRTSQVYLPHHLRNDDDTLKDRASYYLMSWPYLKEKWQKGGALEAAFANNRPLGLWRQIVQELYDIKLKL